MMYKALLIALTVTVTISCTSKSNNTSIQNSPMNSPFEKTSPNNDSDNNTLYETNNSSDIYFQMPNCEGACTKEDMNKLMETSKAESSIVNLVNESKNTVVFSMYTFSRKPIFHALVSAIRRSVKIRGMVDYRQFRKTKNNCSINGCIFDGVIGSKQYSDASIDERVEMVKELEIYDRGSITDKLAILLYNLKGSSMKPSSGKSKIMHNKFVLVDENKLYSGSGNWSYTAMSVNYENYALYTSEKNRDIVDSFICTFDALWNNDSSRISSAIAKCQAPDKVYFTPYNGPFKNSISSKITHSINNSKKSIKISMHHLVHKGVLSALEKALNRNVELLIIFDDDDCNKKEPLSISRLKMLGAKVRYMETNCSLFQLAHNKYGIFDDTYTINGSANWSKAGLGKNYENFVVLEGSDSDSFLKHFKIQWDLAIEKSVCECDRSTPSCQERYCLNRRY